MRTRFSKGVKIERFITPTLISNEDLVVLPTLDSDQSYTFSLDLIEDTQAGDKSGVSSIIDGDILYLQVMIIIN